MRTTILTVLFFGVLLSCSQKKHATHMESDLYRILDTAGLNEKYGYVNMDGKIIIEPKFKNIGYFKEGLASFCVGCETGGYKMLKEDSVDPSS